MATNNKTSLLIDSQLPEFIKTEGPKFEAFVKAYYEWMETNGQFTERSKNLIDYAPFEKGTLFEFPKGIAIP